ncbi:MAG: RrF2 family transcriptional regulator [Capsulimonadaceae bacterium]
MLSITKRADYALLALSHLALDSYPSTRERRSRESGTEPFYRLINTKEIAERYEIPLELLAKILQILAKNGLIASHPGPAGGYRLLRDPAQISVGEVVAIIDGPLSLMQCSVGQETSCRQYNRCTIRSPLATIEVRVKNLLDQISIAEISSTLNDPVKFEDFAHRPFAAALPVG